MLNTEYKFGEVHDLASQVEYGNERVNFRSIFENGNGGVSLLAFKAGQNLAEHLAPAEVMIYVVDGEVEFTMIDRKHLIKQEISCLWERVSLTALSQIPTQKSCS